MNFTPALTQMIGLGVHWSRKEYTQFLDDYITAHAKYKSHGIFNSS